MSKTPEQAVIQADREAAANWYASTGNEDAAYRSLHPVTPTGGALAQAFARHRLAHSQPVSEGLREEVHSVVRWLESVAKTDPNEIVADGGITAGMVISQEARTVFLPRLRAALAASPLTELQSLGQEWEADDLDKLVANLCQLHQRFTKSRFDQSRRPLSVKVGSNDATTIISAALAIERLRKEHADG